jgi:hypothetical protein
MKTAHILLLLIICIVGFVSAARAGDTAATTAPKDAGDKLSITNHIEALGFALDPDGLYTLMHRGSQIDYETSVVEIACTNRQDGTKLTLVLNLEPNPKSEDNPLRGKRWRVVPGERMADQNAALALAKRLSPKVTSACSEALTLSKTKPGETKAEAPGYLLRAKAGRLLSVESVPGPPFRDVSL